MFKELLLQFLKEKDQILFEKTNIHLYEEKDFLEIETWSEDFCKEFFNIFWESPQSYLIQFDDLKKFLTI
jgi:hypothetical protein